ncbi:MAG: type VI secretion system baseplate subunit TssF, partial [Thermodesulfobacteriota bacterium]|nr:type VI secretion system baseplate subunit TssF [Thermodesulfobacteriota bacterium]
QTSGFNRNKSLFSYPLQSFSGFSLLQEYFIFSEKFLFFELANLNKWQKRGEGSEFEIIFEFFEPPMELPSVNSDNFSLFCAPVVNLFSNESEPALVDHTKEKIRIRASSKTGTGHQIYSVDKVTGFVQGSVKPVEYFPMDFFSSGTEERSFFRAVRSLSSITNSYEVYLFLAYSKQKTEYARETLSIDITCTNGTEPEQLMPGDICEHTSNSPLLLDFVNITSPTSSVEPPLEGDTLWRMVSHTALNLLSLTDTESFKKILQLYIFPDSRDKVKVSANLKRIQGISGLKIEPEDRLIRGMVVRGQKISMAVNSDNFASMGDVVVFGSVMDEFFSRYSSINSYTRFSLTETVSGEFFSWKARMGSTKL